MPSWGVRLYALCAMCPRDASRCSAAGTSCSAPANPFGPASQAPSVRGEMRAVFHVDTSWGAACAARQCLVAPTVCSIGLSPWDAHRWVMHRLHERREHYAPARYGVSIPLQRSVPAMLHPNQHWRTDRPARKILAPCTVCTSGLPSRVADHEALRRLLSRRIITLSPDRVDHDRKLPLEHPYVEIDGRSSLVPSGSSSSTWPGRHPADDENFVGCHMPVQRYGGRGATVVCRMQGLGQIALCQGELNSSMALCTGSLYGTVRSVTWLALRP